MYIYTGAINGFAVQYTLLWVPYIELIHYIGYADAVCTLNISHLDKCQLHIFACITLIKMNMGTSDWKSWWC